MRGAPSRFRSQEMLQELFEEINDYLGDKPSETRQVYPSLAPSNKVAVESIEPAQPKKQDAPPQPFLVESDESDDENYQRYTTSPQGLRQQCLLTCPITEEKPSVCMCYKCNKRKSDELHLSPPKKAQQARRSWTPTNPLGFGGIADKVKQTFIRPQQQQLYKSYTGYEAQENRPSSRGARRRWIPRPKSLPSLSLYVQKQEEPEERHSWNANKHKHRVSMYEDYGDEYDDRRSSTLYEPIAEDEDRKQDFMDSSYQGYQNNYHEQSSSSQSQYRSDHKELQTSQSHSSDIYTIQPTVSQQERYRNDYHEPLSSQQQYSSDLRESQSATLQSHHKVPEPQVVPSQAESVSQTPLPGFTDLPYLTPSTRIGEEHYPLSMKESRTLPTKEERMMAYNNAYYHCIMAKSNLIPWLTKQYSKGPPDAMFEYTPKPKKAPKKLLGIFKLCGNSNNPAKSKSLWQPSVSPGYLISPPTSASPAESISLTSSVQPQQHQQTWVPAESSISPASNNTAGSTLSTVTLEEVNYPKEDDESFEPVLPRPRSISVSPKPRRSRSRASIKDEVQPVSILKKTRSSVSLQPRPNPYSDEEEEEEQVRPKYLAAPPKQQHRRGHVKRRSFSQVEEPVYYRPEYYDNDEYGDDDDDYFEEDEKRYRPPRIAFRPRAHPAFFAGSRLNHLRASRSPVWLDDAEFVEEDEPRPMRRRRTRRPSFGRPSSRNSLIVYDDMVPVPRSSPVYYY